MLDLSPQSTASLSTALEHKNCVLYTHHWKINTTKASWPHRYNKLLQDFFDDEDVRLILTVTIRSTTSVKYV